MKKTISLFSLYLTIGSDVFGWGVVLTIFAPLILSGDSHFLSNSVTPSMRGFILGFLIASYPFAQFVSGPFLGELSDHFGRKKVLIVSLFITAIAFFFSAVAIWKGDLTLLFIMRTLAGLCAGNTIAAQSGIVDMSAKNEIKKRMSLLAACQGIAFVLGPFLGGKLSEPKIIGSLGFSFPFLLTTGLFFLNFLLIIFFYRDAKKFKKHPFLFKQAIIKILDVFGFSHLRTILNLAFLFIMSWSFFLFFFPAILVKNYHLEQGVIGDIMGYFALWFTVGSLFISKWFSKVLSPTKTIIIPLFITAACLFVMTLSFPVYVFYFTLPFVGICIALILTSILTIISIRAGKENQGKAFGMYNSLQALSFAICPMISGVIMMRDIMLPMILSYSLLLVTALLGILLLKIPHEEEAEE